MPINAIVGSYKKMLRLNRVTSTIFAFMFIRGNKMPPVTLEHSTVIFFVNIALVPDA